MRKHQHTKEHQEKTTQQGEREGHSRSDNSTPPTQGEGLEQSDNSTSAISLQEENL